MTAREATIHHLKQLKGQPLKAQLSYILTSFRVPIVIALVAIYILSSLIVHWVTQKPTVLNLSYINTIVSEEGLNSYLQDFAQAHNIDTDKATLLTDPFYIGTETDAGYEYLQSFMAKQAAGSLDITVSGQDTLLDFAYQSYFCDLRELLTEAQLNQLSSAILYVDLDFMEQIDPYEPLPSTYPDPTKPEEMENPIPFAIMLQSDWTFSQMCLPDTYQKNAIAVIVNAGNMENAKGFLQFILDNKGS